MFTLSNDEDKEKLKRWKNFKQAELQNKNLKFALPDNIKYLLFEKAELQNQKNKLRMTSKEKNSKDKKIHKDIDLNDFL